MVLLWTNLGCGVNFSKNYSILVDMQESLERNLAFRKADLTKLFCSNLVGKELLNKIIQYGFLSGPICSASNNEVPSIFFLLFFTKLELYIKNSQTSSSYWERHGKHIRKLRRFDL